MSTVGRAQTKTPLLPGDPALLTHQPVDPVLAAALAQLPQGNAQPRTAIGSPTVPENRLHQRDQLAICPPARPLVFVLVPQEPATADLQRLAQLRARIVCFKLGHYFESLEGFESETMAKAFFKMSRCRRR